MPSLAMTLWTQLPIQEISPTVHRPYLKKRTLETGIPKEYFPDNLDPEIRAAVEEAVDSYRARGCEIIEVELPTPNWQFQFTTLSPQQRPPQTYLVTMVFATHHRSEESTDALDIYFKSRGEGFGEEVKRRICLGSFVLSSGYYDAYYLRAQKVRNLIRKDFQNAFKQVDALLTPTSPTPAFKFGERTEDPLTMYLSDIFTINVNLAGFPAPIYAMRPDLRQPSHRSAGYWTTFKGRRSLRPSRTVTNKPTITGSSGQPFEPIMEYEPVIGLEVHVQLKTNTKCSLELHTTMEQNPTL